MARRMLSGAAAASQASSRPRVVCVEGNIGSGKTTFLRQLARSAPPGLVTLAQEPIHRWRRFSLPSRDPAAPKTTINVLDQLYSDPHRWGFAFNMQQMLARLQTHSRSARGGAQVRLMERSVFSTYRCFVESAAARGELTEAEKLVLRAHFDLVRVRRLVDLFVYVRVHPERCMERMRKRGRDEEAALELSFLQHLHELHEGYFGTPGGVTVDGVPVLVVDNEAEGLHCLWERCEENRQRVLYGDWRGRREGPDGDDDGDGDQRSGEEEEGVRASQAPAECQ